MLTLRDPIHGFVKADELETALISTRPLQRLRQVRQLGLANLVFPGAEHSRFSHVLGAMHLAGRMYDALAAAPGSPLDPDARAPGRRALRAAALLHDVGHAPFSHTAEDLFDSPIDHETMSCRILVRPELSELFADHDVSLELVLGLLSGGADGPERLLCQVISGELDVDKMDYLLRDSLFCGVQYGQFDLERLLETVTPILDPETQLWGIGVDSGGVHALEGLVLARYYMFTQVYFNVTGKVLELHLNEWLRETGRRWSSDPERFLEDDDITVIHELRRSDSIHARALLERERYALAWETKEHLSADEKQEFEARLAPLREHYGSKLLVSNSAKDPHRLGRSRVLVRSQDSLQPMETASHFIRYLTRIDRYRVYCPKPLRTEVATALQATDSSPS